MRQEIEAAIMKAGLEDRISITGWISGQRVREEIEMARALVSAKFCGRPAGCHHGSDGPWAAGCFNDGRGHS